MLHPLALTVQLVKNRWLFKLGSLRGGILTVFIREPVLLICFHVLLLVPAAHPWRSASERPAILTLLQWPCAPRIAGVAPT